MRLWITLTLLLIANHVYASGPECKLAMYRFNKSFASKIEVVVAKSGDTFALGFRMDESANMEEEAGMGQIVRICIGTGVMEPYLYKFKRRSKTPHTLCTNINIRTLGMYCDKASSIEYRLFKPNEDGSPQEVK